MLVGNDLSFLIQLGFELGSLRIHKRLNILSLQSDKK